MHNIGEVYYIGSDDFGTTWKAPQLITINGSMASGTFDDFDNLHITYAELLPDDSLNYFTRVSNNNGATLSSPIKLVNTSYLESINKYFGAYCSTIQGVNDQIHAFWIDWRNNDFYLQHSFWSAQYNADITEEDYPFYLQIFPNPVTEFVITKSSSALKEVRIFNLFGKQLANYKNPIRSSNFDLSNFQSGCYLIKAYTEDNKIIIKKIIKLP